MHPPPPTAAEPPSPQPSAVSHSATDPPQLILLKARAAAEDKYDAYFRQVLLGPAPLFVPPLTEAFDGPTISKLAGHLSDEQTFRRNYSGIVLTSQRGAEGLRRAVGSRPGASTAGTPAVGSEVPAVASEDTAVPVYVVGPATAAAARAISRDLSFPALVGGEDAGSGANLARFILGLPVVDVPRDRKLLHVVGEKRDGALRDLLVGGGVGLEELVVYETRDDPGFKARLEDALVEAGKTPGGGEAAGEATTNLGNDGRATRWIVVFAPSGLRALLEALAWLGEDGRYDPALRRGREFTKVLAIGPTTQRVARDDYGFDVDGAAGRPTPEGIWETLQEVMARGEAE